MLTRASTTKIRKREPQPLHHDQESSAPKRLKRNLAHRIDSSMAGFKPRERTMDSVASRPIQSALPLNDWRDGRIAINEAPQGLGEHAELLEDGLTSTICPIISNLAFTEALPEYPPIFDVTIPPLYPFTSHLETPITDLPDYPPIFEDTTIPPLYPMNTHPNLAFTEALPEYPPIFDDVTIPPLYPFTSHLEAPITELPSYPDFEDVTISPLYPICLHSDVSS
ncbi:hypothetical protein B0I35DRAFT_151293 [Stachybotrys elegans]|uniref:Uncharacterized protein n=1 Tax=Stachybotrys elegans TaxID=80388 RepID=A0A8K0SHS1_9HYPO|nr:hypothetical protein B0I35DRAFT_151293 [Stachybotrys elegans]